jgi:hypothetical protein
MGNVLFENLGRGKFRDVSKESGLDYVGHSSGAVFFDYDNDGLLDLFLVIADLDVVVAEFNDRPQVLISNLSDKKTIHYLKIKLEGTMSNRDGLGSTSRVKAGGKTFTQYHDGKSGYLSQSSLPLYFALGEATKVDGIKITWPSGTRQTITSKLGINCQMQIKEPSE